MRYLLFFLFFCLSLGQLQRISLLDGQVNLYFHDIFLLLFVVINLLVEFKDRIKRDKFLTDSKPFLPLIITGVVSLAYGFWNYTLVENFVGWAYLFRLVILFIFFVQISTAKETISKVLSEFLLLFVLVLSYIQYFFYPNFWPLIYLGWDPHLYRAVGTFFDATTAGVIFIFLGYVSYFLYLKTKQNHYLAYVISFFLLMALTYSRITYIAFLVSLIFYLHNKYRQAKRIFKIISFFLMIIFLLPRPGGAGVQLERVFSIKSRIVENKQAMALFVKNPILGVGYNRIAPAKKTIGLPSTGNSASGFPSSFMTVLVSMGLVGLASFLYLFIQLWKRSTMEQMTLLVALFTASLLENVFFVPFVFVFFAISYRSVKDRSAQ